MEDWDVAAMRILVCGGRNYWHHDKVHEVLNGRPWDGLCRWYRPVAVLITGGAPGADSCALRWAIANRVPYVVYEAEWKKYGKRAGPIRNSRMLADGKPQLVVGFKGGKGTADMIRQAKAAGVEVYEVNE